MRHAERSNGSETTENARRSYARPAAWVVTLLLLVAAGAALQWWRAVAVHGDYASFWRQLRSLGNIPLLAIEWVLFLSPGAFLLLLFRRWRVAPANWVMACITLSALTGYAAFWVYFLDYRLGRCFSVAVALAGIWGLLWRWRAPARSRDSLRALLAEPDVRLPLTLMFLAALFYVAFLLFFDFPCDWVTLTQRRFLPGSFGHDSRLPMVFAQMLFHGDYLRAPVFLDWHNSDRPPLQAGIELLQRPFGGFFELFTYQILGTICQCVWVPAVWALCRAMSVSARRTGLVVLFCMLSGFFLFNSVYVWPKLLAGGLVVWAMAILLQPLRQGTKPTPGAAAMAGLAAGLGYLAHGGAAFTLIALAVLFVAPPYFIGIRQALSACAVFAVLLLPWTLYQRYYDPPGNRLLKWHIAGVVAIDARTTWQALSDQYSRLSAGQTLINKGDNVLRLFPGGGAFKSFDNWRVAEYYLVVPAVGVLNFAWLLFGATWVFRRWTAKDADRGAARLVLCAALLAILDWVLLMFGGESAGDLTVVHQGSYATVILLYVGLGVLVLTLPRPAAMFVLLVQAADFLVFWALTTPSTVPIEDRLRFMNLPMIVTSILAFAAIVAIAFSEGTMLSRQAPHPHGCEGNQ